MKGIQGMEEKEVCKVCKKPLHADDKKGLCTKCMRKKQIAALLKAIKIGKSVISKGTFVVKIILKVREVKKAQKTENGDTGKMKKATL